ncbi:unnamed protein product [Spirodela intermedia]|uniref:X8 domain-containing protein n=1 Tax=Spirodela intermedia TaxID=51605 RepID=A0A7I8JYD9_SPIIN|nr:unnamed protein product [Spirodela intermedia]
MAGDASPSAALLLLSSLLCALSSSSGGQSWCVARAGAMEAAVQAGLDYACGGGADCTPIQPAGSCFNPNTLRDHASYAFSSYYQRNPSPISCDFGGTAAIVYVNPSTATCIYPATSAFLPTPTISNPTGTGTVFGPNNPLGSANPTGVTTTSSSTAPAGGTSSLSAALPLSQLTLLIGSLFISRWPL